MADPTKFAFSGYWRASYTSATNWAAVTTAGVSATTGALVAGGLGLPNAGSAQNGLTPANVTGDKAFTNGTSLSTLFQASTGTVVGLYKATTLGTPATTTTDPQFWSGSSGFSGLALDSGGIFGWHISGSLTVQTAGLTFGTSAYVAFRMRWDGTTLGVQLNGNGTEDTVSCGAPDSLVGTLNVGIDSGNANWLDGNMLEIGTLDFTMNDRVWRDYGIYLQDRYALNLGFAVPIALVSYPAFVERRQHHLLGLHTSRMQATALANAATLSPPPTYKQPWFPDRVDRPTFQATQQQETAGLGIPLGAGASSALKYQPADFPDSVFRPTLHASQQLAACEQPTSPLGAGASSALLCQPPDFPDSVIRPSMRADRQLFTTGTSPLPERKSVLASVDYPDNVLRPWFRVEQQLFATELSPSPLPTIAPLTPTSFPALFFRPWFSVAQQQATTSETPSPQGVGPGSLLAQPPVHPSSVSRPWFSVGSQLAASEYSPYQFPVIAAPATPTSFPDFVTRPTVRVEQQVATTVGRTERTSVLTGPSFPSAVTRPWLTADRQLATAFPIIDRTATLADVSYPSRITRPWFPVQAQRFHAFAPKPEGKIASDWYTRYPDRVARRWLPVALYPYTTFWPVPIPTVPIVADIIWQGTAAVHLPSATTAAPHVLSTQTGTLRLMTARGARVVSISAITGEVRLLPARTTRVRGTS